VYVALRDAFDAAKRQLEDYGRRLRRETKAHPQEYTGLVARLIPRSATASSGASMAANCIFISTIW